jgi:sec-independent protein translocase protein TatB
MPSLSDSAVIFVIALVLLGPKELPKLARWLGKLMGEFRRASNEFRLQMEDEFRVLEQDEQKKKIAAIEAAAPVIPLNIPEPEHPHMPAPLPAEPAAEIVPENRIDARLADFMPEGQAASAPAPEPVAEPVPIASSGDLHLKPPATGLPLARPATNGNSSLSSLLSAIPHTPDPDASPVTVPAESESEASPHG